MLKIFAFVALLVCSGCVGNTAKPEKYGNFANAESAVLIHDAMSLIQSTHKPAKTRFVLLQTVNDTDAFGVSLLKTLRASGYGVNEYAPPVKGDKYMTNDDLVRAIPFAYVLDYSEPGQLQLVLNIGDEIYSRTYTVAGVGRDVSHHPAGYWTRKQLAD